MPYILITLLLNFDNRSSNKSRNPSQLLFKSPIKDEFVSVGHVVFQLTWSCNNDRTNFLTSFTKPPELFLKSLIRVTFNWFIIQCSTR